MQCKQMHFAHLCRAFLLRGELLAHPPPGDVVTRRYIGLRRPLSVLSLIYRAWGGIRVAEVAEAMIWQEKWIHPLAHAYRRKCSSTDVAMLIATMIELARLVAKTIAGAGTDYAKCFDLIPQEISQETASKLGMAQGVSNAMGGMYKQLQRAFKMNSSLGKFFAATNGILQGVLYQPYTPMHLCLSG